MVIGVVAIVLIGGVVLMAALNGFGQPRRKPATGDGSVGWVGSGSDCDSGSSDGGCDGGGGGGGD